MESSFENFKFSKENAQIVKKIIARYPKGRKASAMLPLFDLAQRQCGGWLPASSIACVAQFLEVSLVRAYEVASFYTMFNLEPVGRHHVQICGTTPCLLRGANNIKRACEKQLKIHSGETTADGLFTLNEVECLGACVNAPVAQINDNYFEDLSPNSIISILKALESGEDVSPGSVVGRQGSEPKSFENKKKGADAQR